MECSYKTLVQVVFISTKIINRRRLTRSWMCLRPFFFKNSLNLFASLKQNPVRILYPQILQSFTKTLRYLSRGVLEGMTDLDNFGSFIRWRVMKINFVFLLKLHPSTLLRMFSCYVSKQSSCKHGVERTLVEHWLSVATFKHHLIKAFQPPVFADYLFERQYCPVYEHHVPYVKGIPLQPIKNPKAVNESCSLKKLFFNSLNINIDNSQFHPFLLNIPVSYPLEIIEDLSFFDVHRRVQKRNTGLRWVKKLDLFLINVSLLYSLKTS